ncbi:MAG TPA: hypothetical protein PKK26_17260, partial [Candidatus Wallbacteria bacterium]|nr:hypothetical protein [Candidatus Wallbacteria bacterium]
MQDNKIIHIINPKIWSYKNFYKAISNFSLILIALVTLSILGGTYFGVFKVLERINGLYLIALPLKGYLLKMTCFSFFSMLVLSSMISFMSTFFTARDLPLLFSMPLTYRKIFAAKFAEMSFFSVTSAYLIFVATLLAFTHSYGRPFWVFLLSLALATPFFYILPVSIGSILSLFIAKYFPVNQAKKIMYYLIILIIAFLVVLFRALEPEKLISVEKFEAFANYLMDLNSSTATVDYIPSSWISNVLHSLFSATFDANFYFNLAAAYFFTIAAFALCMLAGKLMYRECYLKYQEEQEVLTGAEARIFGIIIEPFTSFLNFFYKILLKSLPQDLAVVLDKDVKTFVRTQVLMVQILMMIVVTVFYLYNITLLPVATKTLSADIVDMFGFLNIGMIALIVASYAIRFVFPVFSMEGKAFYIVKTSSIDMRKYLRLKFLSNFIPMFLFSMILCYISCKFMMVRQLIILISFIDIAILTFFICHLNLYLGIIFPVLDASISEIPASFGGMVTMILCVAYTSILL